MDDPCGRIGDGTNFSVSYQYIYIDIYLYLYIYIYIITNNRNVWLFVDHASLCHMVTQIIATFTIKNTKTLYLFILWNKSNVAVLFFAIVVFNCTVPEGSYKFYTFPNKF